MAPLATFTEVTFGGDPEREPPPRQTPFDVVEHPFRVIVHDSEFHVLRIGTTMLGPSDRPLYAAQAYARLTSGFAFAIIYNRASLSLADVLVKDIEKTYASRSTYTNPQHPAAGPDDGNPSGPAG